MRYMIIVKASAESEAGVMPSAELLAVMNQYHAELARAGMLMHASGLQASSKGWRIQYRGRHMSVVDGPFAETKEIIAGFTIIQVKTEGEAREWTARFPNPNEFGTDCHVEVRRLFEPDDFRRE